MKIILSILVFVGILLFIYLTKKPTETESKPSQVSSQEIPSSDKINPHQITHNSKTTKYLKLDQKIQENKTNTQNHHAQYLDYRQQHYLNTQKIKNEYLNRQHQVKLFREGGVKAQVEQKRVQNHQQYAKQHQSDSRFYHHHQENNFIRERAIMQQKQDAMRFLQEKQMTHLKYKGDL